MEWYTSDEGDSSDLNSDLSVWSDSDDDGQRPATAAELRQAYFSEASLPGDAPRNDMLLRKNETRYTNRRVEDATPILSAYDARSRQFSGLDEAFGSPLGDDRETAGYLVDSHGRPYAKIMESKPPPPNTNRLGQSHQRSLRRALGYDPHVVHRKGEAQGVTNGADVLNGDADIADARHQSKKSLLRRGDAYHNQSHLHDFSDVDAGRSLYDGYNTAGAARDFEKRRHHVQHTWRNALRQEHDPSRAETQLPSSPVHGHASTVRKETSSPFARTAHGNHSTVQLDSTMDIPIVHHKSMREGEGSIDRVVQSHVAGFRAATGSTDAPGGEREMEDAGAGSFSDVAVSARRVEPRAAQRDSREDDERNDRPEVATALAELGASRHAAVGDHIVPEDVVDARDTKGGGTHVAAPAQHAAHTAGGTDASSVVADANAHAGVGDTPKHTLHDAMAPKRAATDYRAAPTPNAGGGAVEAAACVDIGEDRPPVAPCAMWYFSGGQGAGASRHRSAAPDAKGRSGTCFLNDRLSQPHASDWRKYDARTTPTPCDDSRERLTPVPHERRSEPPLRQLATGGAHIGIVTSKAGRSTPLHWPTQASPMALR